MDHGERHKLSCHFDVHSVQVFEISLLWSLAWCCLCHMANDDAAVAISNYLCFAIRFWYLSLDKFSNLMHHTFSIAHQSIFSARRSLGLWLDKHGRKKNLSRKSHLFVCALFGIFANLRILFLFILDLIAAIWHWTSFVLMFFEVLVYDSTKKLVD